MTALHRTPAPGGSFVFLGSDVLWYETNEGDGIDAHILLDQLMNNPPNVPSSYGAGPRRAIAHARTQGDQLVRLLAAAMHQ